MDAPYYNGGPGERSGDWDDDRYWRINERLGTPSTPLHGYDDDELPDEDTHDIDDRTR
jgi:hypothetical protein